MRKLYRCLASAAPPLGRHVHWVSVGQRKAGEPAHSLVHSQEVAGSSLCVLEVLQVGRRGAQQGPALALPLAALCCAVLCSALLVARTCWGAGWQQRQAGRRCWGLSPANSETMEQGRPAGLAASPPPL